jgi:DMSO/TMAO reductase YedYZ molybdopterin-dependent catalytic subunit
MLRSSKVGRFAQSAQQFILRRVAHRCDASCDDSWNKERLAEWTCVPLRGVLEAAGILLSVRFVNLFAYDNFAEGIDMWDAFHPRTILAYGMNGRILPLAHGTDRSMAGPASVGDDPFRTFGEWNSAADRKAYGGL